MFILYGVQRFTIVQEELPTGTCCGIQCHQQGEGVATATVTLAVEKLLYRERKSHYT